MVIAGGANTAADRARRYGLGLAFTSVVACAGGVVLAVVVGLPLAMVGAALAGLALLAVSWWRPAFGCALLIFTVPLLGGLGRNTFLPLLRPNEAIAILVTAGAVLHYLPVPSRRRITALDVTVATFLLGVIVIAWAVIFLGGGAAGMDTWQNILGPFQYLVLYTLFSRVTWTKRSLRLAINLLLAASVLVAFVGFAQLANVGGVRAFIAVYYPGFGDAVNICKYGVCRPTSLLEHPSSFGAFAALAYGLALSLITAKPEGYSRRWLTVAMAINAAAVFISLTQAAVIGLVVATAVITWHQRRVPKELLVMAFAVLVGVAAFWPAVSARLENQLQAPSGSSLVVPESINTRLQYWDQFFLPLVKQHIWLGTATVIPTDIPTRLDTYVDNEYLGVVLRAGVVGLGLLVTLYVVIGTVAIRQRRGRDPMDRAIGSVGLAAVLVLAIIGTTAEYLTFLGVAQEFWFIVGAMAALNLGLWPAHSMRESSEDVPAGGEADSGGRKQVVVFN
jgi:hypothetical protein